MKLIHLSDIHFRKDWHENHGVVFNALFEDMSRNICSDEETYAIISGDIAQAGNQENDYLEFCTIFDKKLNDINITKNKRFVVPGNHDISRDIISKNLVTHEGIISQNLTETEFNDYINSCENIFKEKFSNFMNFENRFIEHTIFNANFTGGGHLINDDIAIFCLNSAIFASGGTEHRSKGKLSDKRRLVIDTRSIYKWIHENDHPFKILVMHHPLDWLSIWAENEMKNILHNHFSLCLTGHSHEQSVYYSFINNSKIACISAPPLFTKKSDNLGYTIISLNTRDCIEYKIKYRHWSKHNKFISGSYFSGTDDGEINIKLETIYTDKIQNDKINYKHTAEYLKNKLEEALTVFPSQPKVWIERKLSICSEIDERIDKPENITTSSEILKSNNSLIIKAPAQFGLTCLARYIALESWKIDNTICIYLDIRSLTESVSTIQRNIDKELNNFSGTHKDISCIIVDSYSGNDNKHIKILKQIAEISQKYRLIIMETYEYKVGINTNISAVLNREFSIYYLKSLSRNEIRSVVSKYNCERYIADEDTVLTRLVSDIDSLNIHRTPLNCITVLKASEINFSESPVNRTEVLKRVLFILFNSEHNSQYRTLPDMQDCEFALGYFCEQLVRKCEYFFTKDHFIAEVKKFCKERIIDLEVDDLFKTLNKNHIIIKSGTSYSFKFSYWIYYFIAQRMHQDSNFAEFILSSMRYASTPEVIEFYTGIDRRRDNAINVIINDMERCITAVNKKCNLPVNFNLFKHISWSPSLDKLETMEKEIREGITESNLPEEIKDQYADKDYDRTKPYDQAVHEVLSGETLQSLLQITFSASRGLRNSDYIAPELKIKLINTILNGWQLITQILCAILPALAEHNEVLFDGAGFIVNSSFGDDKHQRFRNILTHIPYNIITWYKDDLFSPKISSLLDATFTSTTEPIKLHELAIFLIRKKPTGWAKSIASYINNIQKNSFYLMDVDRILRHEYMYSFLNNDEIQDLKFLIKLSIAKHSGAKKVGESTAKQIPDKVLPTRENFEMNN